MNLLLTLIVGLCCWTVSATHKNTVMLADLYRIVQDGKEQRLVFTGETKQMFKECTDKLHELDGRVTVLENKVVYKP
jgi:hypothetical protein